MILGCSGNEISFLLHSVHQTFIIVLCVITQDEVFCITMRRLDFVSEENSLCVFCCSFGDTRREIITKIYVQTKAIKSLFECKRGENLKLDNEANFVLLSLS